MGYDNFLQILKWWGLNVFDKKLIYVSVFFSIQPQSLQGLHEYFPKIFELFWDIKMEEGVYGKNQKYTKTNQARILHNNSK